MKALATDGPYEGREFDHNDIDLYTTILPVGLTKFLIFPPLENWDDVTHERIPKEGPFDGDRVVYWLERHPDRLELHHDRTGEAMAHFQKLAESAPPAPKPKDIPGTCYECGKAEEIPDELGWDEITDEKDRKWRYHEVPKTTQWFSPDFPSGARRAVGMHVENLAELRQKLSDILD